MSSGLASVRFPVLAVSSAGWSKLAAKEEELTDASPDDPLEDWQGMEIYDSAGLLHRATRAFRAWPKSRWGWLLCRALNHTIHVGFEFGPPERVALDVLLEHARTAGEFPGDDEYSSHEQLLRVLTGQGARESASAADRR